MEAFIPKQDARGFIVPKFIQYDYNISVGARYLYGVLCDYARDRNFCYPSKSTLAKQVKCSLNTIRSWLKELIRCGLVKTFFSGGKDIFYLFWPAEKNEHSVSTRSNFAQDRSNFAPKSNVFKSNNIPPTPCVPHPAKSSDPPHVKKRVGDFSNINKNFEEFWEVYPKKEAKETARSLWFRLSRQCKIPSWEILQKTLEYFLETKSWQRENGRFIPYLVNFLRGLRWNDVPKDTMPVVTPQHLKNMEIESPAERMKRYERERKRERTKEITTRAGQSSISCLQVRNPNLA